MEFFRQKDKRKVRRNQDLINFTITHYAEQCKREIHYRTKPNQVLIRGSNGAYKIVSKTYSMYHMQDDEYETENELEDEEWEKDKKLIQQKYI
jgi:NADH:ubiquinone oxidoreductase subunit